MRSRFSLPIMSLMLCVGISNAGCSDGPRKTVSNDDGGYIPIDFGPRDATPDSAPDGDAGADASSVDGGCRALAEPTLLGFVTPASSHGVTVAPAYASGDPAGIDALWVSGSLGAESIKRRRFSTSTGMPSEDEVVVSMPVNAMDNTFRAPVIAQDSTVGFLAYTGPVAGNLSSLLQRMDGDGLPRLEFAQVISGDARFATSIQVARMADGGFAVAWLEAASSFVSTKDVVYVHITDEGVVDQGPTRITEPRTVVHLTLARQGAASSIVWTTLAETVGYDAKMRAISATGVLASESRTLLTARQITGISAVRLATSVGLAWSEAEDESHYEIYTQVFDDDGDTGTQHPITLGPSQGLFPRLTVYGADSFALVYFDPTPSDSGLVFRGLGTRCEPTPYLLRLQTIATNALLSLSVGTSSDNNVVGIAYELADTVNDKDNSYFLPIECR